MLYLSKVISDQYYWIGSLKEGQQQRHCRIKYINDCVNIELLQVCVIFVSLTLKTPNLFCAGEMSKCVYTFILEL